MRHTRALVWSAVLATAAAVALGGALSARSGLTVHEWGTFTSIAGPDGQSVHWAPLSGPQDLPCFVERQPSVLIKGRDFFGTLKTLSATTKPAQTASATLGALLPRPIVPARIRMETPVLYFYSPEEVTLDVQVLFMHGLMSEWYPKADASRLDTVKPLASTTGTIQWPSVRVLPNAAAPLPHTPGRSHYYAARDVDAATVQVRDQYEKFLFYRGLADFQPTVKATLDGDRAVSVTGRAGTRMILFENYAGRVGYRFVHAASGTTTIARPDLSGDLARLRADLVRLLTAEGLYLREAQAMVETWRDSWFEEGTRIFYIVPKDEVDVRLPLTISPRPAEVARVFVGRLELVTPEMKNDVERALKTNDLDGLNRYGRFLDAIALQMTDRPWIAEHAEQVAKALTSVTTPQPKTAACQQAP